MKIQKLKVEIIPTLLIILFGFSNLGKMLFLEGTFLNLLSYIAMASIGGISTFYALLERPNTKDIKILIALYLAVILSAIHTGNYRLQEFYMPFMYLGIGFLLMNFKINHKLIYGTFIMYVLFFSLYIPKGINYRIFPGYSRNYYSVIMIYNVILVYIADYENNIKTKITPALITFIISLWAIGRSGIIASALLLIFVFIEIQRKNIKSSKYARVIVTTILILIFLMISSKVLYEKILYKYFERLITQGLSDRSRTLIIQEYIYLAKQSFGNFVFGVPIRDNYLFSIWNSNLHNSFARLHAFFGMFGLSSLICLSMKSFIRYWKQNRFFAFLMCVLFIRMSTDSVAFNGIFDPIIYYFIFNKSLQQNSIIE